MPPEELSPDTTQEAQTELNPTDLNPASDPPAPEPVSPPEAAPEPEVQWTGAREFLAQRGIPTDRFTDDEQALNYLAQTAQQYQQLQQQYQTYQPVLPHAQYLAQNWSQYQQWLAQQSAAQQAQQPQAAPEVKEYWPKPPEYHQDWANLLTTDEQGNIVAKPGAAPDLPQKYQAYRKWYQDRLNHLLQDPAAAIRPGLESWVQEQVEARIKAIEEKMQSGFQQFKNSLDAEQYVAANRERLMAVDPMTGQETLSPQGQTFLGYLQYLDQAGVKDVATRRQIAEQMLARDLQIAQFQQQQQAAQAPEAAQQAAQQANLAHKQRFIQGGTRAPNRSGSIAAAVDPAGPPQNTQQDFRQMLAEAMAKNGSPA